MNWLDKWKKEEMKEDILLWKTNLLLDVKDIYWNFKI